MGVKTLHFDYTMQMNYAEIVGKCHFTLRCMPAETKRQHLLGFQIQLEPEADYEQGEDSFGNRLFFGKVDKPHNLFSFHATGKVVTGLSAYEEEETERDFAIYRYPSKLTEPGEQLKTYFQEIKLESGKDARQKAKVLMNRLYRGFSYEKNVTDMGTSAEEAFRGGRGVCQDYAHIMVALCRMADIPARYVTGMLIGEGCSHAWVEVLSNGKWYGLDPTNCLNVGEKHIKIGTGRDALDAPINRGLLVGGGAQKQEICVKVEEVT